MRLFNYYPSKNETDAALEKKIFKHSLIIPALFVFICWIVLLTEATLELNFAQYGIFPHHVKGLKGIVLAPFIHSGITHLAANSVPFLVLSVALFYFYRKLAYRIFFLIYLFSGIFVWMGGREAWHIGASGIIYGLGAFLFFSGIFRNDVKLLTISIIVVFLYGGMFWGIFPIEARVSWESHLWGSVSGLFLSVYYRNQGPRRSHFEWENEQDDDDLVYNEEDGSGNLDWPDNEKEKEMEKT